VSWRGSPLKLRPLWTAATTSSTGEGAVLSRAEAQPERAGEQGEGGGGDGDGAEQAPEQPVVTGLQHVGAMLAAQRMAEQPELQLPASGTPPADRHQHQQQPNWERGKRQWQQPDQVGGDKAEQTQSARSGLSLPTATGRVGPLVPAPLVRARCGPGTPRTGPESPAGGNADESSAAGVDTVTSCVTRRVSSSLCETELRRRPATDGSDLHRKDDSPAGPPGRRPV
jgi:hypothetical protein